MIRYRNFLSLVFVLAGAAILAAPAPARAAFQMTLTEVNVNTGTTIASTTVVDNGSGDQSSMSGVIGFLGSLGDFNIQLSVGTSNSQYGVQPAQLTINNVSIDSNGIALGQTRQVIITLQDTGFTAPDPGHAVMTSQLSTTQLPTGSNVTFQSFLNSSAGTQLSLATVGGAAVDDQVTIGSSPYTLKDVTTYTIQGQGTGFGKGITVQSTGLTSVVAPAPGGAVLALAGVPFLGLGCWLRRRKKASRLPPGANTSASPS
jgi:hypothetical protein